MRTSRAISTSEIRQKRLALLGLELEFLGIDPKEVPDSIELAIIYKKVARNKMSPERGAKEVKKNLKRTVGLSEDE